MNNIILSNDKSRSWTLSGGVYVKGYAYLDSSRYVEGQEFAEVFHEVSSEDEFRSLIERLNGIFAVVFIKSNEIYLAVDICRSIPLFFSIQDNKVTVTDKINKIDFGDSTRLNLSACDAFSATGYTISNETLLHNVYQVGAAEIISISNMTWKRYEYWSYSAYDILSENYDVLKNRLVCIFERVVQRMISAANGRTIVIPLSGGFDSRIIAVLLKKKNYSNVICFTYGKKCCEEVKLSRKVARLLNYEWHFIEYTDEIIATYFKSLKLWDRYSIFASNYVSIPHIQDFIAVAELKKRALIPSDSLFAPGHSGDIFGGTHIPSNIEEVVTTENIKDSISKKHFIHASAPARAIYEIQFNESLLPYSIIESWSWKERQSKFIVNSVKCYEFFGYSYLLPLWDKELADFFRQVPLKNKHKKKLVFDKEIKGLYDSVLNDYFSSENVGFKKSIIRRVINKTIFITTGVNYDADPLNFEEYKKYFLASCEKVSNEANINSFVIDRLSKLVINRV